MKIPILICSDSPSLPTGLARIARDITSGIYQDAELLGVEVAQLAIYHDEGTTWPWRVLRIRDEEEWGKQDISRAWWKLYGNRRGVVLTVWDPARCFGISEEALNVPAQLWGYFAVDAAGVGEKLTGIAAVTLSRYERVLGYGAWGAGVLKATLGKKIGWLPHGIELETWAAGEGEKELNRVLIGCVAANQPRKDFGLLFEAWSMMKRADSSLQFWLHTDREVNPKGYAIPQLVEDFGLDGRVLVTGVESPLADEDLAALYSQCLVTMAPAPEGFGYPIVESLACGTPVVGLDYAGGAELIPHPRWRVPAAAERWESVHVLKRPVMNAACLATAASQVVRQMKNGEAEILSAYCRGAVRNLGWDQLWPRWRTWVNSGLEPLR